MKIIFTLILLCVIIATGSLYFDNKNEVQVYQFCQSWSKGNSINDVEKSLEGFDFLVSNPDDNTLLVLKNSVLPIEKYVACEIKYHAGKISLLNFIKGS